MSDKTSKFIKFNNADDDQLSDIMENENILEEEEEAEEYYIQTINMIQQDIIDFINSKSVPICEYLDTKTIDDFIYKNIKFV